MYKITFQFLGETTIYSAEIADMEKAFDFAQDPMYNLTKGQVFRQDYASIKVFNPSGALEICFTQTLEEYFKLN